MGGENSTSEAAKFRSSPESIISSSSPWPMDCTTFAAADGDLRTVFKVVSGQ